MAIEPLAPATHWSLLSVQPGPPKPAQGGTKAPGGTPAPRGSLVAGLLSRSGPASASKRTCGRSVLCVCRNSASVARLFAAASPTVGLVCTAMRMASLIVNGAADAAVPIALAQAAMAIAREKKRALIPNPHFAPVDRGVRISTCPRQAAQQHCESFSQLRLPQKAAYSTGFRRFWQVVAQISHQIWAIAAQMHSDLRAQKQQLSTASHELGRRVQITGAREQGRRIWGRSLGRGRKTSAQAAFYQPVDLRGSGGPQELPLPLDRAAPWRHAQTGSPSFRYRALSRARSHPRKPKWPGADHSRAGCQREFRPPNTSPCRHFPTTPDRRKTHPARGSCHTANCFLQSGRRNDTGDPPSSCKACASHSLPSSNSILRLG